MYVWIFLKLCGPWTCIFCLATSWNMEIDRNMHTDVLGLGNNAGYIQVPLSNICRVCNFVSLFARAEFMEKSHSASLVVRTLRTRKFSQAAWHRPKYNVMMYVSILELEDLIAGSRKQLILLQQIANDAIHSMMTSRGHRTWCVNDSNFWIQQWLHKATLEWWSFLKFPRKLKCLNCSHWS